ncbi:MAG: hypothetical protein FWF34_00735, partial [Alphaproteobacteria bacterium]|nr:hypothetical protein [Alphaproteobacteria bacterium]
SQAKVSASSLRNGAITDEDFLKLSQYSDALSKVPLFFDDTPGMSVPMMRTRARRLARKHGGISLVIIDYLQLMTLPGGGRRGDSRVNEVSEITRGLKMLAKELDVPVIALSQLSRAVESRDDKRPLLSDLRESGSIEQDADIVMFTYREEYYLQGRNPADSMSSGEKFMMNKQDNWEKRLAASRGKAELIIGKNRHGRPETVHTKFIGEYSLFDDLDEWGRGGANESLGNPVGFTPPSSVPSGPDIDDLPDDF